jgi:hypothetical protein
VRGGWNRRRLPPCGPRSSAAPPPKPPSLSPRTISLSLVQLIFPLRLPTLGLRPGVALAPSLRGELSFPSPPPPPSPSLARRGLPPSPSCSRGPGARGFPRPGARGSPHPGVLGRHPWRARLASPPLPTACPPRPGVASPRRGPTTHHRPHRGSQPRRARLARPGSPALLTAAPPRVAARVDAAWHVRPCSRRPVPPLPRRGLELDPTCLWRAALSSASARPLRSAPARPRCVLAARSAACARLGPDAARPRCVSVALRARACSRGAHSAWRSSPCLRRDA